MSECRKEIDQEELIPLAQLGRILYQYEQQKDLDNRYVSPPTKEKMRFPEAALKVIKKDAATKGNKKMSVLEDEGASGSGESDTSEKSKGGKKKTKKSEKSKSWKKAEGKKEVE